MVLSKLDKHSTSLFISKSQGKTGEWEGLACFDLAKDLKQLIYTYYHNLNDICNPSYTDVCGQWYKPFIAFYLSKVWPDVVFVSFIFLQRIF